MSGDAKRLLFELLLVAPFFLAAPAVLARRWIGLLIALAGTLFGGVTLLDATMPVPTDGPLDGFATVGYLFQGGYGLAVTLLHGTILLVRGRGAWRDWRRARFGDDVPDATVAGRSLPRARLHGRSED